MPQPNIAPHSPKGKIGPYFGLSGRFLHLLLGLAMLIALWPGSTPAAHAAEAIHVVRPGDSLGTIAQRYQVSPEVLQKVNGIVDPNLIQIGQSLIIPQGEPVGTLAPVDAGASTLPGDGGYHRVQAGESLSQIASQYGLSLSTLLRLNGLPDANTIWVGQKLRLTARVAPVQTSRPAIEQPADLIHVVQADETLAEIARRYGTTQEQLMVLNGLPHLNFLWPGQRLRIKAAATSAPASLGVAGAPADGQRWIEIDLSDQTLTAWQGDVVVMRTIVSTGKWSTPTVKGDFAIYLKLDSQHMYGDDYDLPNVPWVMYFYEDYAIHGAYWHTSFGIPVSHGCVNMRPEEAEALYRWASVGTLVRVHD